MFKVRYIGLDVHKDTIVIAIADEGRNMASVWKTIQYDEVRLLKSLKLLQRSDKTLKVCYEAGPTGYGIHRRLTEAGIDCQVVAPSLIPTRAGNRVKTDHRDARQLAQFHRSGDLTPIYVPDESVEALRDLERAREDAKRSETVTRHQLSKFLLRHSRRYTGGNHWTCRHLAWVRSQKFSHEAQKRVLCDYIKAMEDASERVKQLDKDIDALVWTTAVAPLVRALMALRGVSLITATTIAAEIGDMKRFSTASKFMAYLGLVPSEHSSGKTQRRGGITRTGNSRVRRLMVESAWHYRHLPNMSRELRRRNEPVAKGVQQIAWRAQNRLNRRLLHLTCRKDHRTAVTAVARELAGFVWAIAQEEQLLASSPPTGRPGRRFQNKGKGKTPTERATGSKKKKK
jgi:transposase